MTDSTMSQTKLSQNQRKKRTKDTNTCHFVRKYKDRLHINLNMITSLNYRTTGYQVMQGVCTRCAQKLRRHPRACRPTALPPAAPPPIAGRPSSLRPIVSCFLRERLAPWLKSLLYRASVAVATFSGPLLAGEQKKVT